MKHYYLLFLFAVLLAPLSAQLRVEPEVVNKNVEVDQLDADYEDVTSITVTNTSNRSVRFSREAFSGSLPSAWEFSTLSSRRTATLGPGQSTTFFVAMRPGGSTGSGSGELRLYDLDNPGTVIGRATVRTSIQRRNPAVTVSSAVGSRPPATTVRLFPNPAPERFFVEAPAGTRIGRVEVSNLLGRRLRSFDPREGTEGYDVEKLPDGMYLISIFDDRGKKLKTLRLLHRQGGGA